MPVTEPINVFEGFANSSISEIVDLMKQKNAYATGKSARSLEYEASDTRVIIRGGAAFFATDRLSRIETGRGPTSNSQGGVLYPAILEWVKARGINGPKGQESIARAITSKIHREGTSLHKRNEQRIIVQDVFSQERLQGLVTNLSAALYRDMESAVVKRIKEGFKVR